MGSSDHEHRQIGTHRRVVERMPAMLPGKKTWPLMQCLDCELESEYEEEFMDKPCPRQPAKEDYDA